MAAELSPILSIPLPVSPAGNSTAIKVPPVNPCFSCPPPSDHHSRCWMPNPNNNVDHPNRTLVLCFDGTGDCFNTDNSNVVQFVSMLKKDDTSKQLVYYQAGVGTYASPVLKLPVISGISKTLDLMFAWSIPEHIIGGYQFLMQNYTAGDKICIFGFSRGAFTARALAGMLQKVGLLPTSNEEQLSFAYAMFSREDDEGLKLSIAFKSAFSVDVSIEFLGVWDTVQSVGLIPRHVAFSGYNTAIVHFRHALSLDERRVKFMPSFCIRAEEDKLATKLNTTKKQKHVREGSVKEYEYTQNMLRGGAETDVEEVFFAGVHCDVGGGSVRNGTRHSLARIPLRWMIRECFRTKTGIIFDAHMLKHKAGLDIENILQAPPRLRPHEFHVLPPKQSSSVSLSKTVRSFVSTPFIWTRSLFGKLRVHPQPKVTFTPEGQFFSKSEANEELHDALTPIYDQLPQHWYWKFLEHLFLITKKQSAEIDGSDDPWAYKWVNRGAGREVYHPVMTRGMKVHRSVKTRIEALNGYGNPENYTPKIRPVIGGAPRCLTVEEWLADNPEHFKWVDNLKEADERELAD